MTKVPLLIVTILYFGELIGQQLPMINTFSDNMSIYNPGAVQLEYFTNTSTAYTTQIGAVYRTQWLNLEGAPKTQNIFYNKLIKENYIPAISFGGNIVNDKAGPISQTSLNGRIAIAFGDNLREGLLSGGLSIGINNYRINFNEVKFAHLELFEKKVNEFYPDIGFGVFFAKQLASLDNDVIYGGFAIPKIFMLGIKYEDDYSNSQYNPIFNRHYLFNIGYVKYVNDVSYFETTIWSRFLQSGILSLDVLGKYKFNESFYLGAGFSSNKAVHIESGSYFYDIGIANSAIKLSYSLTNNFLVSDIYLPSTHELSIQFFLANKKGRRGWR